MKLFLTQCKVGSIENLNVCVCVCLCVCVCVLVSEIHRFMGSVKEILCLLQTYAYVIPLALNIKTFLRLIL